MQHDVEVFRAYGLVLEVHITYARLLLGMGYSHEVAANMTRVRFFLE